MEPDAPQALETGLEVQSGGVELSLPDEEAAATPSSQDGSMLPFMETDDAETDPELVSDKGLRPDVSDGQKNAETRLVDSQAGVEGRDQLFLFKPITPPPTSADVKASMRSLELPDIVYAKPFFSDPKDVPNR